MQAEQASRRLRLDDLLVHRGLFETRSRARDAIARGAVTVAGAPARKAGQEVTEDCDVVISDPASGYVSRAALKLIAGLDHFELDPLGAMALDLGASTGGFTQVLLERGASRVIAVDVGHGQMHSSLRIDPRVTCLEGINARALKAEDIGNGQPTFLVSDLSFISLRLALPPALGLCAPGAKCVLLVKPQFEAGRDAIGKGGLLKRPDDAQRIAEELRQWLAGQPGWTALGLAPSPILGGDGNAEFLLAGAKSG